MRTPDEFTTSFDLEADDGTQGAPAGAPSAAPAAAADPGAGVADAGPAGPQATTGAAGAAADTGTAGLAPPALDENRIRSQLAAIELNTRFAEMENRLAGLTAERDAAAARAGVAPTAEVSAATDPLADDPAMKELRAANKKIDALVTQLQELRTKDEQRTQAEAQRTFDAQVGERRKIETANIKSWFKDKVVGSDPELRASPVLQTLVGRELDRLALAVDYSQPNLDRQYAQLQLDLIAVIGETKRILAGPLSPDTTPRGAAQTRDDAARSNLSAGGTSTMPGAGTVASKYKPGSSAWFAEKMGAMHRRVSGQ